MKERLIFPTSIEQVGTSELIHTTFSNCKWANVLDEPIAYYVSDIELNTTPSVFFEWAFLTPARGGNILFYCLNLSMEYLIEPANWMRDIVNRHSLKRLSGGK